MTSRQLALNRGKTGDVQRFSLARPADPARCQLLQETLAENIHAERRNQILNDPTNCFQYACRWGDSIGFLTRPTLVTLPGAGGNTVVHGNFTDTIGQAFPVSIPLTEFRGSFTTLVRREDALQLNLSVHPKEPATIVGPRDGITRSAELIEASLERLNFDMPEEPGDGDYPVIAALPCFLPVGPGQSFPHTTPVRGDVSFRESFLPFHVWRGGLAYCLANNDGQSVTVRDGLFHLPALRVPDGDPVPFEGYTVVGRIFVRPTPLVPTGADFQAASENLRQWSDTIWVELGNGLVPADPPPVPGAAPAAAFGPDQVRAVVEPLMNKDKQFRLAPRTAARYKLLLAAPPAPGGPDAALAVIPELAEAFTQYLAIGTGSAAAEDLRELVRSRITVANGAETALEKDVTLEADNITLAFSDRIRTFTWLVERASSVSLPIARSCLGLIHFLTPDREALALVVESDLEARSLVMANASTGSIQVDAAKSSKLYSGGRLTTFRHSYEAICNLRMLLTVMSDAAPGSYLVTKLLEYTNLLMDRHGRTFFEMCRESPHLAVHPWQDLQHILSAFLMVATRSDLYQAVLDGRDIAAANYANPIAVADGAIQELRAIINGNGLGKFAGTPYCAPWFTKSSTKSSDHADLVRLRGGQENAGPSPPKRQKIDSADVEHRKTLGILTLDTNVSGSTRLPNMPVYHKKKGAKGPERLCMKFLTRGYACTAKDCRFPHISKLEALSDSERAKMIDFVKKQPGLNWAEGKGPAGTPSS